MMYNVAGFISAPNWVVSARTSFIRKIPICTLFCCYQILLGVQAGVQAIELSMPVACELGETCFIQNYFDVDESSTDARDHRCGRATYNGHKGTDFRLLSIRATYQNVPVLAAADGAVSALRDGIPDRLIGGDIDAPPGKECGNGVIVDHGEGWETQYCHMRNGSIAVRRGDLVKRGDRLGVVGYSGKAQFAHLHLSVRRNGTPIDPFTGRASGGGCGLKPSKELWSSSAKVRYMTGALIQVGFSNRPITTVDLELGRASDWSVTIESRALIFFARFINLNLGDEIWIDLIGPRGFRVSNPRIIIQRVKAQYIAYVGKRLRANKWNTGNYIGHVELRRKGHVVRKNEAVLKLSR